MPYSNIVFVKLFLSLFEEDDRFLYQLNESQQLLYVKMLYMAGATNNKITKNIHFIKSKINYHHEDACFLADLERIKIVFPNGFKESKDFYYFKNFNELHNYIGKSKGNPKEIQSIVPDKEKNKRREREEKDKRDLDFSYLKAENIKALLKTFGSKDAVVAHLKGMGFFDKVIGEYFEKAGVK